ncbi:MAG: 16S rRNA (guanine(527)-N(7))-methyltransferase RsmG [Gammaproteobacteria bacterium]|nr:16S rRNA (guanine(527)-N(7))-methyltransferase RsmG [Gammaproteobacteria bacterium]
MATRRASPGHRAVVRPLHGGTLRDELAAGARALGLAPDEQQLAALLALQAELADWNQHFNLTAIRAPGEMLRKHLLDSLAVRPFLGGRTIADVGTGAGFPGLPLAIVDPARQYTLIEATGKKARFVAHAVERLGLGNVVVINVRAETWRPPAPFDRVLARALGPLADFIRVAGHLCQPAGRLLALKGRYPADEVRALPRGWQLLATHPLHIPGLAAQRHLLELARS